MEGPVVELREFPLASPWSDQPIEKFSQQENNSFDADVFELISSNITHGLLGDSMCLYRELKVTLQLSLIDDSAIPGFAKRVERPV